MLAQVAKGGFSIQLFYTEDIRPARLERFLIRAKSMEKLSEIYIVPVKTNNKEIYRVLYGIYANKEEAHVGIKNLPKRYADAFAPTLYELDEY